MLYMFVVCFGFGMWYFVFGIGICVGLGICIGIGVGIGTGIGIWYLVFGKWFKCWFWFM